MPARDPQTADMAQMLMNEAKQDSSPLADMLFGQDAFTDSQNLPRPQYLAFLRYANEHGLTKKDGTVVPADEWSMQTMDRLGQERYWADLHEAYGLDPAQGLAQVRMGMEPPPFTLPPGPPGSEEAS